MKKITITLVFAVIILNLFVVGCRDKVGDVDKDIDDWNKSQKKPNW